MTERPSLRGTEEADARLDRLERESLRRKWDSALIPIVSKPVNGSGAALQPSNPGLDRPLVDLLNERLGRLELRTIHLERENQRLSWENRRGRQISAGLGCLMLAVLATVLTWPWMDRSRSDISAWEGAHHVSTQASP